MLAPADVLNIECKFVERMKTFLKKRKSLVGLCYCEVLPYFSDMALATLLEDCLEYPDICELQKKAATYPDNTEDPPVSVPCEDQLSIGLISVSNLCNYQAKTNNPINNSANPSIVITDDSEFIDATINLMVQDYCAGTNQEELVEGGCTSGGCSDDYRGRVGRGITTTATNLSATSYITKLRVYEANPFGSIVPGAIDLDLNPATSPYYTASGSCPGCTTVNAVDVRIGSSNFVSAFGTLMDNVSLARYSETGRHKIFVKNNTSTLITTIGSYYWHNPSEYIFGINKSNAAIWIYNPVNFKTWLFNSINYNIFEPIVFYEDSTTFTTKCGDITPVIGNQSVFPATMTQNANFNYIDLISPFANGSVQVTSNSNLSCTYTTLSASYITTNVDSVEWLDPDDNQISTSSSVTVTDAGTYTFNATLNNGCIVTKTITI